MTYPEDDDRTVIKSATATATGAVAAPGHFEQNEDALPDGTRIGEFEILRLIGVGGFGIVYLAHDHSLGRNVALKEYMPSALAGRKDGLTVNVEAVKEPP